MPRRAARTRVLLDRPLATGGAEALAESMGDALADALERGEISPGELIPPVREISARHGVNYEAVRRALVRLADMGILKRLPSVGYSVARTGRRSGAGGPVGMVVGSISSVTRSASTTVAEFEKWLAAEDEVLLLGASGHDGEGEDACIRRFRKLGVRGLAISPAVRGKRSRELARWVRSGAATVLMGHPGDWLLPDALAARCGRVDVDNRGGVRQAMDYLLSLGHRRIGYVSPGPGSFPARLAAFTEYSREKELPARQEWIVTDVSGGRDQGRRGFERLRRAGELPSAVLCPDDRIAAGVVGGIRAAGLDCPGDVSVVGFEHRYADTPVEGVRLASVDYSRELYVQQMIRSMRVQLKGLGEPEAVLVPMHLIPGESCARPGRR